MAAGSSRPDSLTAIQTRLDRFREERDWGRFHNVKDLSAAISVEAAELQELFLWTERASCPTLLETRMHSIEDELADIMIHCLNFARAAGIDVVNAINCKIDDNEVRYPVERARGIAAKYDELLADDPSRQPRP